MYGKTNNRGKVKYTSRGLEVSVKVNKTAHLKTEHDAVLLGNGCLQGKDALVISTLKWLKKKVPDSRL